MSSRENMQAAIENIPVTKTFLPPQEKYNAILKRAWDNQWVTNRGALVVELETKLKNYLGVKHITATNNGTSPLQIAIKALDLQGEIITTPFSYVATTASIVWQGCTPVFVDIDPGYLTIDENKIAAAITPKTSAILVTHVFGNPCDIEAIEALAQQHGLKVIYDAAHCFGVHYKGSSIFNYGDVNTCSFHATKLYHTAEGGAIFCNDADLHHKLFYHHNFGHDGPEAFFGLGINAKMSEVQAAMGLAVLPYMDNVIEARKAIIQAYDELLGGAPVQRFKIRAGTTWNYSYYPVIFASVEQMARVKKALEQENIFPRRYFYPALSTLPYVNCDHGAVPVAESIASRILCLPLYHTLTRPEVNKIARIILSAID